MPGDAARNDRKCSFTYSILYIHLLYELLITNTHFKHKEIHTYTRELVSRNEKSLIDYFLVSKSLRNNIKDVKVKRGAEIGSDHFLVTMKWYKDRTEKEVNKRKKVDTYKNKML